MRRKFILSEGVGVGGHSMQALRGGEQGALDAGREEGWGRRNTALGGGKRPEGKKTQTCS